jgi:hypothetical protein
MTSPTVKWVPRLGVTDMWGQVNGQHLTGQRSTRVGSKLGRLGSGWAGLGRAGPNTWHAVRRPRHGRGLLLGLGFTLWAWARLTVDPSSRSMDRRMVHGEPSPPVASQAWSRCSRCTRRWSARGGRSPVSPAAVLLPAAIFTDEPQWRGWCPIREGESFPGLR